MMPTRITDVERRLLVLAADADLVGPLADWPVLRGMFERLGAPALPGFRGVQVRTLAQELLVELGLRPRPDGPLVCVSPAVFRRTFEWPARSGRGAR